MRLTIPGALVSAIVALGNAAPTYPPTRRVDQVDVLHGVKVEDPYRWLEADVRASEEVANWVAWQNKVTFAYLKDIPEREAIKKKYANESSIAGAPSPSRNNFAYVNAGMCPS